MRPQRDALTRHATPMNASDVVHKIIFKAGGALKPSAKTTHGTHQRRNPLGPLHSRSRSGLRDLDTFGSIFEFGLMRIRLQLAIYFCLHRRQVSRKRQDGKPVKRAGLRIVRHRARMTVGNPSTRCARFLARFCCCHFERDARRIRRVKYWETIADNLKKAGSSLGWFQPLIPRDAQSGLLTHHGDFVTGHQLAFYRGSILIARCL